MKTQPTPTELLAALTRLYASGYASGHHDTVEGVYTDVVYVDRGEYHRDVVEELLADSDYAALTTLSAREDGWQPPAIVDLIDAWRYDGKAANASDEDLLLDSCANELENALGLSQQNEDGDVVRACPPEEAQEIDAALGLELVSVRLPTDVLARLKLVAADQGIWHVPLIRHVLTRYADEQANSGTSPKAPTAGEGRGD